MFPMDLGPIYRLGRVIMTPNARASLSDQELAAGLLRHVRRAWGEREHCDQRGCKERSRLDGCRILSACCTRKGTQFWIITEADRALTQVLLPQDHLPV